jgi:hypothetical protein
MLGERVQQYSPYKKPKKSDHHRPKQPPTPKEIIGFRDEPAGTRRAGTQRFYISKKNSYLYGVIEIEIQNRIMVGFSLGFAIYKRDKDYDFSEYILYLGLISIHIKNF